MQRAVQLNTAPRLTETPCQCDRTHLEAIFMKPALGLEPTTCCLQNPKWLVFMAQTGVDSSCRLEPCGASQSQLLLHDNGRMWTSLEVQPVRDTVRSPLTVRDTVRTVRTIFGGSL